MKTVTKVVLGVIGAAILALIIVFISAMYSSKQRNDYLVYLRMTTDAALITDGVYASVDGSEPQLLTETSVNKLYYYFTRNMHPTLKSGDESGERLDVSFGYDSACVLHTRNDDEAVVYLNVDSLNVHMKMLIRSDGLWQALRYNIAPENNIPVEEGN